MSRLEQIVSNVNALCDTVTDLEFAPPGIFTNAIITKPEVTSLIRDALVPEQSLYKISRSLGYPLAGRGNDEEPFVELKPERIDGKSMYIEKRFEDWKTTAVRIPEVVQTDEEEPDELSSPTKKQIASQYKLISPAIIESGDVNDICAAVSHVVGQYPGLVQGPSVQTKVLELQKEYNELVEETSNLETEVADQKRQLDYYNDSLNELSPSKREKLDIDEMISNEEDEIKQLEEELTRRQGV